MTPLDSYKFQVLFFIGGKLWGKMGTVVTCGKESLPPLELKFNSLPLSNIVEQEIILEIKFLGEK